MNGYRPIVELMNANFGIYGMAELSSCVSVKTPKPLNTQP
jgi:pyruvate/2-oxoglutarate/acetoin dehydrogenase E1 component